MAIEGLHATEGSRGRALAEVKLAFVVLTWNSERYVDACIASVLSIECAHLDLLVFENGSTDATADHLDAWASRDDRVHVVRSLNNVGTTTSRNICLRLVAPDVDYVCILDSDTVVNQGAFETMVAHLERDRSLGVIGPTMADGHGVVQLSGRSLPTLGIKLCKASPLRTLQDRGAQMERPHAPVVDGLQEVGYLLSACWLVPRRIFDEVGLLDERIFYAPEDVDFCLRVTRAGYRVVHCPAARIVHEYQRLSKKRLFSMMNARHVEGLLYYFCKHRYLFDASRAR